MGSNPFSVIAQDMNGDGLVDIVTANYNDNTVSVLLGNGDATFRSQQTFATDTMPRAVIAVDFDGDGRMDLATANSGGNSVSVLYNTARGSFAGGELYTVDRIAPTVQSIARTGGSLSSSNTASYVVTFSEIVTGLDRTDFFVDTTGALTVGFIGVTSGTFSYTVTITGISGNGDLTLKFKPNGSVRDLSGNIVTLSPTFAPVAIYGTGTTPAFTALGDLNGDGFLDAVTANLDANSLSVRLGDGAGNFGAQATFATGTNPRAVALSDVNGDGFLDALTANKSDNSVGLLLGNGDGTFRTSVSFAVDSSPYSVKVADVNGDGFGDILTTNQNSMNISLRLGNGDGTFGFESTIPTNLGPETLIVADVNGDGFLDLFVGNRGADNVSVIFGNGDGTFLPQITLQAGFGPSVGAVADVNNDGNVDLLVSNITDGTVSVLRGLGSNEFGPAESTAAGPFATPLDVVDINGDGLLDIVVANLSGTATVLLGQGDGTFLFNSNLGTVSSTFHVVLADLNGDGRADVVTSHIGFFNSINVLLNTTPASLLGETYTIDQDAPTVLALDRFDPTDATTVATTLTFAVTFSEHVTGVSNSAFIVNRTGNLVFLNMSVIADSPTQYRVVFSGVTGAGTLQLSLQSDTMVSDFAGNILNVSNLSASYLHLVPDVPDSPITPSPLFW